MRGIVNSIAASTGNDTRLRQKLAEAERRIEELQAQRARDIEMICQLRDDIAKLRDDIAKLRRGPTPMQAMAVIRLNDAGMEPGERNGWVPLPVMNRKRLLPKATAHQYCKRYLDWLRDGGSGDKPVRSIVCRQLEGPGTLIETDEESYRLAAKLFGKQKPSSRLDDDHKFGYFRTDFRFRAQPTILEAVIVGSMARLRR